VAMAVAGWQSGSGSGTLVVAVVVVRVVVWPGSGWVAVWHGSVLGGSVAWQWLGGSGSGCGGVAV
jgi:hypothetical protein